MRSERRCTTTDKPTRVYGVSTIERRPCDMNAIVGTVSPCTINNRVAAPRVHNRRSGRRIHTPTSLPIGVQGSEP
jgi:hypothetical protein